MWVTGKPLSWRKPPPHTRSTQRGRNSVPPQFAARYGNWKASCRTAAVAALFLAYGNPSWFLARTGGAMKWAARDVGG